MRVRTRHIIFLILSCSGLLLNGQQSASLNDTLRLNDVIVNGRPMMRDAGFNRMVVDSTTISENISSSLSDILQAGTSLFVKTYGPGGIATVSLRGGGASHTVVTWNGLNLNSPMAGQTDFSIIPAVVADEIFVFNGGSSAATAQGGLGGVVEVGTVADWNSASQTDFSVMAGSYGRYSSSLISRYGKGRWKFASRFNYRTSGNDFRYTNNYLTSEPVVEKRYNASASHKIAIQEIWYKNFNSVTGAKVWLQESNRDIPVPINVSPTSHDESIDNNIFRGVINHDRYFAGDIIWSSSASFQSEKMRYADRITGIESPSSMERVTLKSSALIHQNRKTSFRALVSNEASFADTPDYSNGVRRNIASFSIAADRRIAENVDISLNTGISLDNGKLVPPDISSGVEYRSPGKYRFFAEANLSAKSRIPTLNDLYWVPGGNPNLLVERGFSAEAATGFTRQLPGGFEVHLNLNSFYNRILNMIVWLPGENGLWRPSNINDVTSEGLEASLSTTWRSGNKYMRLMSNGTLTKANDRSSRHQLIYVPVIMSYTEVRAGAGMLNTGVSVNYTGKRYIVTDNSQYLNGYCVTDIWAGCRTGIAGMPIEVTLRYENLFNVDYQTMAFHPMPPRSVTLNLAFRFTKNEMN
ncbi:MAG: TonB-dependent receptor [Bacteroidales bacterium]|nr:TonB-dependent receptor [Bacteroidales bacterium]